MEPRAAALEPPVLADRGLGQRAAGADGEEREACGASRPRPAQARRGTRAGSRAPRGRSGAGTTGGRRRRARRCPTAPRAPLSPASSSTCSCRRRRPRSRASRAVPPRGCAPAPARRGRRAPARRARWKLPVAFALHRAAAVRPELDREETSLVRPVLEDATGGEKALQLVLGVRADAARECEAVRPVDRCDRVELDCAEPADRRFDLAGLRAAEAWRVRLRRYGRAAGSRSA